MSFEVLISVKPSLRRCSAKQRRIGRLESEDRKDGGIAQGDHPVVQDRLEGGLARVLVHGEGKVDGGRGNHLELLHAHLEAAGGLLICRGSALHPDHRLERHIGLGVEDELRAPAPVAQHDEGNPAQVPDPVDPPAEGDRRRRPSRKAQRQASAFPSSIPASISSSVSEKAEHTTSSVQADSVVSGPIGMAPSRHSSWEVT